MHRPKHLLSATMVALTLGLAIGCATDGDDTFAGDTPSVGDQRISFPRDGAVEPPAGHDEEQEPELTAQPKNEIPTGAVQLQNWRDDELGYEADEPGFIYVFDETDNRIVYSGKLGRGERFILDRQRSRATINGVVVYAQDRDRSRNFKVYFDRE